MLQSPWLTSTIAIRKFIVDYSSMFMFLPVVLAQMFFASQGSSPPPMPDIPASATPAERAEIERVAREMHAQMPDPKTMNTMGCDAVGDHFSVLPCTSARMPLIYFCARRPS